MDTSPARKEHSPQDPIQSLQAEIAEFERELANIQKELAPFEREIHLRLDKEIARIQALSEVYKRLKKEKKAKRLEQKKKGKNYKEPTQVALLASSKADSSPLTNEEQSELKRLYKEAVVQFHPDKFSHAGEVDKIKRATAITAQLNSIYKRGDLDELVSFYQFIVSGSHVPESGHSLEVSVDPKLRLAALRRKREGIRKHLQQVKNSYLYTVLTTYDNPLTFINELQLQFEERIKQLEKRTRKA
jgi:hypothetical protein